MVLVELIVPNSMPHQPTNLTSSRADRLIFRPKVGPAGDVLVAIFLRGGMDGLYTVPPFGDRALQSQRKTFGASDPSAGGENAIVNLDDFFGLHSDLAPLESLYRQKLLAVVHAVGLEEPILSHFDATRAIEQGAAGRHVETGWIGRHLASTLIATGSSASGANQSPMRAIAMGGGVPRVLQGSPALSLESLADYRLEVPAGWDPGFTRVLRQMYGRGNDLASVAGRETFDMLGVLRKLSASRYQPANSAVYSPDEFGDHLSQVAQLIKADVGLEAAVLSLADWDSHVTQIGFLKQPMQSLAMGLAGFVQDLGERMRNVVVVVMSEFGRRVVPNDSQGTDHGRGSAMFVIGGGIRGGKVYGRWPGMANADLDEQGNLRVTTDFRDVLAEIVTRRLKNPLVERVFPQLKPNYLNLTV